MTIAIALVAACGALFSSPPASSRGLDRRLALQTAGSIILSRSAFAVPAAHAVAADSQKLFDDFQASAASSLSSTSKLLEKIETLDRAPGKSAFLFTAPSICKASKGGAFVSVRLWRPTGGEVASEVVKLFEARFAKLDKKPEGQKAYYGAVARANEGEEFALFANVFETQSQAENINTQELAISKKKVIRANLQIVLPVYADPQLETALGECS